MKKWIILLVICVFLIPVTGFASISIRDDCRIGSMGVIDTFDIDKGQQLLGTLVAITHDQRSGGYRYRTLVFSRGKVSLRDDTIISLYVTNNYGMDNRTAMGTPRGIVVGHDLNTVLHLYGIPDRIYTPSSGTVYRKDYIYSAGDGAGITFTVNPKTNKVIAISVYVPGC